MSLLDAMHERGRATGKAEGQRVLLRRLIVAKFGSLPHAAAAALDALDADGLDLAADRVLTATRLEDVLPRG